MINQKLTPMNVSQLQAPRAQDFWAVFSHDAKRLYSGGDGSRIWVWDVQTRQLEGSIDTLDTDALFDADLDPTAERLAAAGRYPSVRIWNLTDGQEVRRAQPHRQWATAVQFCDNGRLLVSAGLDHTVRTSDTNTGKRVGRLKRLNSHIHGLAASQESRVTGVVYYQGVKVWNRKLEDVFHLDGFYYHGGKL
jgi:WD40 repeat protein